MTLFSQSVKANLTFSNALSMSRIFLVPVFIYLHQEQRHSEAMWVFLIAIATDWFDGKVARWTGSVSEWGKILDPLADKLSGAGVTLYAWVIGEVPLWFLVTLLVRDAIIFGGGIYAKKKKAVITTSLLTGKIAVGFLAGMLAAAFWNEPFFEVVLSRQTVRDICLYIALVLLLVSFYQYAVRFFAILNGAENRL